MLLALKSVCELLKNEGQCARDELRLMIDNKYPQMAREIWVRGVVQGRSFCISEQKRFCNATCKARSGDLIAVLAGGTVLFLLRPSGDNYQYVGTVWAEDLVDSALYKDVSPDEVDYDIRLV